MSAQLKPGSAAPLDGLLADDTYLASAAAALDRTAAELDEPLPGAPAAAPVVIDWQAEAHDLVDFTTGMFFPLYPRLATVWTAERCGTLERRLAAVLKKYNLDMGTLLGKWGPELMLAAAIAPAVLPTYRAIHEDLDELRAKAREQARAAPAPAGAPQSAPPPDLAKLSPGPPAPPDQDQLHKAA